MNQYFPRLAQRSSVVAAVPGRQSRDASAAATKTNAWGAQHFETIAPGNSLAHSTESNNSTINTATNPSSTVIQRATIATASSPKLTPVTASAEYSNEPMNNTQLPLTASSSKVIPSTSRFLSIGLNSSSVNDNYEELTPKSSSSSISTQQASTISSRHDAHVSPSLNASREQTQRTKSFSAVQTETTVVEPTQRHASAALPLQNADSFEQHDNQQAQHVRVDSTASSRLVEQASQAERVASNPVQTTATSIPASRSTSRPSVQVHIGKIELEVYAPQTKSTPTPTPAPQPTAISKPSFAARGAIFNPHRHYLRGR